MTTATKKPTKKVTAKRSPRKRTEPVKVVPPPEPTPLPTTITLPATLLATAWRNVSLALSRDEGRPVLCSLGIEVYGAEAVRLVATDSYMIMHSFVSDGDEIPADVEPLCTYVANDYDQHGLRLMKWLLTARIKKEERTVKLDVGSAHLTVDIGDATVKLPLEKGAGGHAEVVFPNWRPILIGKNEPQPTAMVALAPKNLARIARVTGRENYSPLKLEPSGPLGPVHFTMQGEPNTYGAVMPVRCTGMRYEEDHR